MARDTLIAEKLRRDPVLAPLVVELAGWRERGSDTFAPRGFLWHHTAGPLAGVAPSLAVCTYGRTGLVGPLCNVYRARDRRVYVVAAGRANHAGSGSWKGLVGNSSVYGLEVENTGYGSGPRAEPWTEEDLDDCARIARALEVDPELACHHKEWTSRKIDMHTVTGFEMRERMRSLSSTPAPPPELESEEDDVGTYVQASDGDRAIFHFYGERVRQLSGTQWNRRRDLAAFAGKPIELEQMTGKEILEFSAHLDVIPDPPAGL